ncbi:hypothetical protein [Streptomyces sp. NPDC014676]|uniref:hypothetical protein n=1 Tax=Streptomyces sp. NPDC014676 TaxID=3364879 RepID=UPI0036FE309E
MFSRRNRRPSSLPELSKAWECLDGGDVPGALRRLRQAGTAPLDRVALVVGRAAGAAAAPTARPAPHRPRQSARPAGGSPPA